MTLSASLYNLAQELLSFLATQALYAAILALVVLLCIKFLHIRDPLLRMGLWSLVMLRLVLPIDFASAWSLRALGEQVIAQLLPHGQAPMAIPLIPGEILLPSVEQAGSGGGSLALWLVAFWALGVMFLAWRFLHARRRYYLIARSAQGVESKAVRALFRRWQRHFAMRRRVILLTGKDEVSPFTLGLFSPIIYVPQSLLQANRRHALDAVLGHEMAHVAHGDDLWLRLEAGLTFIFFFLPVVWWAGREIAIAREEFCDQCALRRGGFRAENFLTGLLEALRAPSAKHPALAVAPAMTQAGHALKRRIFAVKSGRRPIPALWAFVALGVIGMLLLPMATSFAEPQEESARASASLSSKSRERLERAQHDVDEAQSQIAAVVEEIQENLAELPHRKVKRRKQIEDDMEELLDDLEDARDELEEALDDMHEELRDAMIESVDEITDNLKDIEYFDSRQFAERMREFERGMADWQKDHKRWLEDAERRRAEALARLRESHEAWQSRQR